MDTLFLAVQDKAVTFTGADIAWIIALILAAGNLINMISNWVKSAKLKATAPEIEQNEKIEVLSKRVDALVNDLKENDAKYAGLIKHYEGTRDRHDKEIGRLSDGQQILIKAMKNLLAHNIYNNHDAEMRQSIDEIDNFMLTRKGAGRDDQG